MTLLFNYPVYAAGMGDGEGPGNHLTLENKAHKIKPILRMDNHLWLKITYLSCSFVGEDQKTNIEHRTPNIQL
jgi:hypothetical protein